QGPVAHVGEHPHAVPLDLVQPVAAVRERTGGGRRGGEHGLHGSILPVDGAVGLRVLAPCAPPDEGGRAVRAIWKGAVAFGLVNVPVRLYAATGEHEVRLHQVHREDGGRIRYRKVCEVDGEQVEWGDI